MSILAAVRLLLKTHSLGKLFFCCAIGECSPPLTLRAAFEQGLRKLAQGKPSANVPEQVEGAALFFSRLRAQSDV